MLQITKAQFSHFNEISLDRYLDRLTALLRSDAFAQDLARQVKETEYAQKVCEYPGTAEVDYRLYVRDREGWVEKEENLDQENPLFYVVCR